MRNNKGLLVVIDGPSGIGKTTVSTLLHSELMTRGFPCVLTAQPSRSRVGEMARYGTREYRGLALACLVAADRYDQLDKEIRPALREGKLVICDRYVPSSLVLQQLDGVDPVFVSAINEYAERPDLTVILTGDPKRSRTRAARRGTYSRFQHGQRSAVRENQLYAETARRLSEDGWMVRHWAVGAETPETITGRILQHVLELAAVPP